MFSSPSKELTIAFAGVFQNAALVHQLARQENYESHALHESGFSLLRLDATSVEEVYGSVRGVRCGFNTVVNLLGKRPDLSSREVIQYAAGMYQLSMQLQQNRRGQQVIEEGLREMSQRYLRYYEDTDHDNELHDEIAALYTRSISYMSPRIMVQGGKGKLENPLTVSRVRTALFAGIRSAWLWRQLGGRRWQLPFQRSGYLGQSQRLMRL